MILLQQDMAAERKTIMSMRCGCGAGYRMVRLSVAAKPEGGYSDVWELKCTGCGQPRTEGVDLPHLKDLIDRMPGTDPTEFRLHLLDVDREYMTVAMKRCTCGGRFRVVQQGLAVGTTGPEDLLSIECVSCHRRDELRFPLPHFAAMMRPPARRE